MKMTRIALASAALAIGTSAGAQTAAVASKPCLTAPEVETLVGFVLPSFVEGLAQKCSGVLRPAAFLRTSAPALAARYRTESPVPWSKAAPVIQKMSGEQMPANMGGEFGAKLMETVITAALVEQVQPRNCATADRIAETLAPLPAANTARLTGMLLELGMKQDARDEMPFRLCAPVPDPR